MNRTLTDLPGRLSQAVALYWSTRENQARKQASAGRADQGLRSAVTGGAQMDGFISLFTEIIAAAGV
ncbi:MAG: PaeR7I family type II restriction endonuclease, partial [Thermodesulfovibrionales bacterium]